MDKHICADCSREFQGSESLNQHRQAKHSVQPPASATKPKGKLPGKLIIAVIVLVLVAGAYLVVAGNKGEKPLIDKTVSANDTELDSMLKFNLAQHTASLALHIHPTLEIVINGQQQVIPANIGITGRGMRVIHTHDTTGKLHIESPKPFQFHLKDFFTIWGKDFNSTCIFDYCADETHDMKVYANGAEAKEPEQVPLRDLDRIEIIYSEKQP